MNTIDTIRERRSIRNYTDQMPTEEQVRIVAEAGTYAASGMNRQPAIIIAVTDPATVKKLSEVNAAVMGSKDDPFYGAPVVFCVLASKSTSTRVYDGSLVMANMMLAAKELGLGTCWIHRCKEEFESPVGMQILKDLGIEGEYEGIGNLIMGYPADNGRDIVPKADYVYYVK